MSFSHRLIENLVVREFVAILLSFWIPSLSYKCVK